MEELRKLVNCFVRFVLYTTTKLIILRILVGLMSYFEVNAIVDINKVTSYPLTLSEMLAVVKVRQNMLVILLRGLATDTFTNVACRSFQALYILYTLFDLPVTYTCKYILFSLLKLLFKYVLEWTVTALDSKRVVHKYIDPKKINRMLSFGQNDSIIFDDSRTSVALSIGISTLLEMLQHDNIFKLLIKMYKKTSNDSETEYP